MRPCTCNRFSADRSAPYTTDQCRLCWLYNHEPEYRRLWDSAATACGLASPPPIEGCCGDGHGNRDADTDRLNE
jgi:hypothetical protein